MSIRQENFEFIRQALYERTAISLNDTKHYLIENRLTSLARRAGLQSVDELVDRLKTSTSPIPWQDIVEALTVNETSFFRDGLPFNILRDKIFNQLSSSGVAGNTFNVWSAACASGQEPYSIAMSWLEHQQHLSGWKLQLFASDISHEMLSRGKQGKYTAIEMGRGLSEERRERFFQQDGSQWKITDQLRKMVRFQAMNLIGEWAELPRMDVIFLRNVLVYFDQVTKKRIFSQLQSVLKPDGFLFLGGSETTLTISDRFERAFAAGGNCFRMKKPVDRND